MLDRDKERVIAEVTHRMVERYSGNAGKTEQLLFDTLYEELRRLETEKDRREAKAMASHYGHMQSEAAKASPDRQREMLREISRHFAEEVSGHFDPRVYNLATRIVPKALTVLLNTMSPLKLLRAIPGGLDTMEDQLEIQGETEAIRKLAGLGTTVLVSTHQSNLDSITLGWGVYRLGLPPYTYGAGLNLFSNRIIGFFMHNLGAYKVDRRKKAALYKEVLKTYAGCSMELGYHNMFFPGGTRSRSGAVEQKLKMGLLGMGLDAYIHNLAAGRDKPDIFVVPCTMNYQLILEAETLIDDWLKEVGKSRYIITDDEFSEPKVVLDFVRKLFSLDSKIHFTICRPLDVFGNLVDEEGRSIDNRGRVIDRARYVFRDGKPAFDRQRDMEYTRELSDSIVREFHRDTVIKPTNLVSFAVIEHLREQNPEMDVYRLLRTGGKDESIPLPAAYERIERTLKALRRLESRGRIRLDKTLARNDTVLIASVALAHFASFHRRPALVRRGDRLFPYDRKLLLYYHNRLVGFDLGDGEGAHEHHR